MRTDLETRAVSGCQWSSRTARDCRCGQVPASGACSSGDCDTTNPHRRSRLWIPQLVSRCCSWLRELSHEVTCHELRLWEHILIVGPGGWHLDGPSCSCVRSYAGSEQQSVFLTQRVADRRPRSPVPLQQVAGRDRPAPASTPLSCGADIVSSELRGFAPRVS